MVKIDLGQEWYSGEAAIVAISLKMFCPWKFDYVAMWHSKFLKGEHYRLFGIFHSGIYWAIDVRLIRSR